jgi:hypothetical protein
LDTGTPEGVTEFTPTGQITSSMPAEVFSSSVFCIDVSRSLLRKVVRGKLFFPKKELIYFHFQTIREETEIIKSIIPSMIILLQDNSSKSIRCRMSSSSSSRNPKRLLPTFIYFHLLSPFLLPEKARAQYTCLGSCVFPGDLGHISFLGTRNGGSHHQIMTHPTLLGKESSSISTLAVLPFLARTGLKVKKLRSFFSQASARTLDRLSSIVKKNLTQILREKGIVTKDDYAPIPVSSEGIGSGPFGNNANSGSCTGAPPLKVEGGGKGSEVKERRFGHWDSRRSYRVHPYWTDNLKYAC